MKLYPSSNFIDIEFNVITKRFGYYLKWYLNNTVNNKKES